MGFAAHGVENNVDETAPLLAAEIPAAPARFLASSRERCSYDLLFHTVLDALRERLIIARVTGGIGRAVL